MTDADAMFAQANPDATGDSNFEPPQDGHHTVTLIGAKAGVKESTGGGYVLFEFQTTDGYTWTDFYGFMKKDGSPNQGAANAAKRQAREMGVNIDAVTGLDPLDEALKHLVGQYFEVTVKRTTGSTGTVFANTYVDGPAQGGRVAAPVSDTTPEHASSGFVSEPSPVSAEPVPAGDENIPW